MTTTSSTSTSTTSTTTSSSSTTKVSGSSILKTLSAGSGIDTDALVTSLVAAAYDTKNTTLTKKEDANTAQISELATINSALDTFSSALTTLISGGTLQTQPSSSDTSLLTATARSGAQIGTLSQAIVVKQLAKAQSLVSDSFASSGTAVGTGSFTLAVGSSTYPVTLTSSNNTLAGIANAINATGSGVTASVVTDTSGARLVLKGATGTANGFTITTSDSSLAQLAYPQSGGAGMTLAQTATNAIVNVDGVDVQRAANTIDDLIDGVSLKLVAADATKTVTLGTTRPTDAIKSAVSDFVSAYNALKSELTTATQSSTSGDAGPFYNDPTMRQMQRQLAGLTSTALNTSGSPQTLAEIGVSTNQDGTLTLNSDQLSTMLTAYPAGVEALFNPTQHASDPLIKITSAMGKTKAGTYQLANLVAAANGSLASGSFGGYSGIASGSTLSASVVSSAFGLTIEPQGNVASATVTVDPGLGGALKTIRDTLRAKTGILASLSTALTTKKTKLADDRTKMEAQEATYKDRLASQFSTMETRVSAAKATQSYLTQQIAAWNKSSS